MGNDTTVSGFRERADKAIKEVADLKKQSVFTEGVNAAVDSIQAYVKRRIDIVSRGNDPSQSAVVLNLSLVLDAIDSARHLEPQG